jgi:hypothetical protein
MMILDFTIETRRWAMPARRHAARRVDFAITLVHFS